MLVFFVLLLFIKSPSTDPNVLWFCFNCSKRKNIFRENCFKIGNSRRNIKLLVTGYYITADCHMPNRKEGKWLRDFNALDKCCWDIYSEAKAQPIVLKQNTKTLTPVLDLLLLFIIYLLLLFFCEHDMGNVQMMVLRFSPVVRILWEH